MRRAVKWDEFAAAARELAQLARETFDEQHLCVIGTIRANDWPRVSPNEIYFVDGELLLGMMPESRKALDLRRNRRITVVTPQAERMPRHGDAKLYGEAIEIFERGQRDRFADVQEAAIDWRPTDPFHLFRVDIASASYISFGEGARVIRWSSELGVEELAHPEG